jgi:hypothetical protein
LTAERLVTKFTNGIPHRVWTKAAGARNEALDCFVYAYAAACFAGLKRANWQKMQARAEAVKPPEGRRTSSSRSRSGNARRAVGCAGKREGIECNRRLLPAIRSLSCEFRGLPRYIVDAAYRLVPTSGSAITFTATADGSGYTVTVLAATTAGWAAKDYAWSAYVTKAAERYTVDSGVVTVLPDPGQATGIDRRSHARKVLDAIEAVLEGRASKDQVQYRSTAAMLTRTPMGDLLMLRSKYRRKCAPRNRSNAPRRDCPTVGDSM